MSCLLTERMLSLEMASSTLMENLSGKGKWWGSLSFTTVELPPDSSLQNKALRFEHAVLVVIFSADISGRSDWLAWFSTVWCAGVDNYWTRCTLRKSWLSVACFNTVWCAGQDRFWAWCAYWRAWLNATTLIQQIKKTIIPRGREHPKGWMFIYQLNEVCL